MIYTSREVYEYISKQTNDPIIERKTCVVSGTSFPIYQSDLDFYAKISPTFAGEKFQIPTPSLCSEERQRRRLSFLNQRNLYKSRCSSCGDSMISRFHNDCGLLVYCNKCRTIDQNDRIQYNIEFDSSKTFHEHIKILIKNTPFQNLVGSFSNLNANAMYTNYTADISDSYMIFEGDDLKYCYYSGNIKKSSYCLDCSYISRCENCYGSIDLSNCFNCYLSCGLNDCSHLMHCINCSNCHHCYGCNGLVGKSYFINNTYVGKEDYNKLVTDLKVFNTSDSIKVNLQVLQSEGSIGNSLVNTKNCLFCYDSFECYGGKYSHSMNTSQDFFDVDSYGSNSYLLYDSLTVGRFSSNIYFSNTIGRGENLYYCYDVKKSKNCFGCVNLKDSEYCIFKKQYTKEDYEIMVGRIIRHMMSTPYYSTNLPSSASGRVHPPYQEGQSSEEARRDALLARPDETCTERGEFFHPSLSPFGYNETVAQEYYPLSPDVIARNGHGTKGSGNDEAIHNHVGQIATSEESWFPTSSQGRLGFGYHRSTYSSDPKIPDGVKTIDCRLPEWAEDSEQWKQLNEQVVGFLDSSLRSEGQPNYDICKQIILCEISGRPFMLQKAEIDFYRKHHISLPRKHPDIRHEERMKLRPGRTLYLRNCDCCGKEILSVYPVETHGNVSADGNASVDDNLGGGYPPLRQQVYCESCYTKEIYG